jgi:hypothetical protein
MARVRAALDASWERMRGDLPGDLDRVTVSYAREAYWAGVQAAARAFWEVGRRELGGCQ